MSDRDMTRTRFGSDGMYADQLNEYAEEVARLRAQVARLSRAVRHGMERDLRTNYIRDDMSLQIDHQKRAIESYLSSRGLYLFDVGLDPLENDDA